MPPGRTTACPDPQERGTEPVFACFPGPAADPATKSPAGNPRANGRSLGPPSACSSPPRRSPRHETRAASEMADSFSARPAGAGLPWSGPCIALHPRSRALEPGPAASGPRPAPCRSASRRLAAVPERRGPQIAARAGHSVAACSPCTAATSAAATTSSTSRSATSSSRRQPWSVPVRGKPAAAPTARRARTPSAMRPRIPARLADGPWPTPTLNGHRPAQQL